MLAWSDRAFSRCRSAWAESPSWRAKSPVSMRSSAVLRSASRPKRRSRPVGLRSAQAMSFSAPPEPAVMPAASALTTGWPKPGSPSSVVLSPSARGGVDRVDQSPLELREPPEFVPAGVAAVHQLLLGELDLLELLDRRVEVPRLGQGLDRGDGRGESGLGLPSGDFGRVGLGGRRRGRCRRDHRGRRGRLGGRRRWFRRRRLGGRGRRRGFDRRAGHVGRLLPRGRDRHVLAEPDRHFGLERLEPATDDPHLVIARLDRQLHLVGTIAGGKGRHVELFAVEFELGLGPIGDRPGEDQVRVGGPHRAERRAFARLDPHGLVVRFVAGPGESERMFTWFVTVRLARGGQLAGLAVDLQTGPLLLDVGPVEHDAALALGRRGRFALGRLRVVAAAVAHEYGDQDHAEDRREAEDPAGDEREAVVPREGPALGVGRTAAAHPREEPREARRRGAVAGAHVGLDGVGRGGRLSLGPRDQAREVRRGGERPEGVGHGGRGGEPPGGVFFQQPLNVPGEFRRHVAPHPLDRRRPLFHMGHHAIDRPRILGGVERGPAAQEGVERAAEAVEVGADIDRRPRRDLLGGEVVDRAHRLAGAGDLRGGRLVALEPGEAEVEEPHAAVAGEHDVRRLDVAVHHAVLVYALEPEGRLADDLAGVGDRQRVAAAEHLAGAQAVDVLHDQQARAADLAGVVGADDVRMIDRPGGLHLAVEAGDRAFVPGVVGAQELHGDHAAEPGMEGLPDRAHSAFAELFDELVLAEFAGLGLEVGGGGGGWGGGVGSGRGPLTPGPSPARGEGRMARLRRCALPSCWRSCSS